MHQQRQHGFSSTREPPVRLRPSCRRFDERQHRLFRAIFGCVTQLKVGVLTGAHGRAALRQACSTDPIRAHVAAMPDDNGAEIRWSRRF